MPHPLDLKHFSLDCLETHGDFRSPIRLQIRAEAQKSSTEIFLDPAEIRGLAGFFLEISREIAAPKISDPPAEPECRGPSGDGSGFLPGGLC